MKAGRIPHALRALIALLLWTADASGTPAAAAGHAAAHTPVAVTAEFYRWYVMKFRSDHDPMLELRVEARTLVAAALLQEVDAQLAGGVTDDDYFLQVDDVVRPCRSPDTALLGEGPGGAVVGVTLGARTKAPWRLRVSLVKEGGEWRIRRVAKDRARPPAAAATHAMSDC